MVWFLAGVVCGGTVGVLVMAVLIAGRRADDQADVEQRRPYIELWP